MIWQEEGFQYRLIFNFVQNTGRDIPRDIGEVHFFSRANFVNIPLHQLLSVVSQFLRHLVRDLPPRKGYLLKLTRHLEEYTTYLCNIVNTLELVLEAVKQCLRWCYAFLYLFDERALFPDRLPTTCGGSRFCLR